jgi:hypothetical protein
MRRHCERRLAGSVDSDDCGRMFGRNSSSLRWIFFCRNSMRSCSAWWSERALAWKGRVRLVFKELSGHRWTINGKSFPKTDPIMVQANHRYRWTFDNQSADPHPCTSTATPSNLFA